MINKLLKKLSIYKLILTLAFFLFITFPYNTNAASLSLLPSTSNATVGNIISIKVSVNTEGVFINNAEANIQFPTDMLEVLSITKSASIFSLWVEEPNFSNNTGKVNFNGGAPTPGFNGQSGYIATITFKAKKQGTASVFFTDASVRANDGLGTNVLISKNGNIIKIDSAKIEVPKKVEVPPKTKSDDKVIKLIFNPSVTTVGNRNVVRFDNESSILDVSYYMVEIDSNPSFRIINDELVNNEYYLPVQNGGEHKIIITAFNKSGSYTQSVSNFSSPMISAPVLTLVSEEIISGDSIAINGKTNYSNEEVSVILEMENNEIGRYTQKTRKDGSFSIITDKIKDIGVVSISAQTVFSETIKSPWSEKIYQKIKETPIVKVTLAIFYPLLGLVGISILLIILFISLYVGWHKYFGLKKKVKKELERTEQEVHKAMLLLKDELSNQLSELEKIKADRNLSKKEEEIFNQIKNNVDNIDDFIDKKLKKII